MSHFSSQWRVLITGLAIAVLTAACGGGGSGVASSDALGSSGAGSTGTGTGTGTGSGSGSGSATSLSISGQPAGTATVGQAYSFQPTASAGSLTFTAKNLPSWLSINASTGAVSGTPGAGDVGTDSNISITVSSGSTSASLTAFTITVNAAATQTGTGSAVLNWTAPTQNTDGTALTLSGYKILYGNSPTALTQSISVTNPSLTTYTVDGLSSGTWYFAIVSMDGSGSQSVPTNVASTTI